MVLYTLRRFGSVLAEKDKSLREIDFRNASLAVFAIVVMVVVVVVGWT